MVSCETMGQIILFQLSQSGHTWPKVWKANLITSWSRLSIILTGLNRLYGHSENINPVISIQHNVAMVTLVTLWTHAVDRCPKEKTVLAYLSFIYWVVLPSSSYSSIFPLYPSNKVTKWLINKTVNAYTWASPTKTTSLRLLGIFSADPSGSKTYNKRHEIYHHNIIRYCMLKIIIFTKVVCSHGNYASRLHKYRHLIEGIISG